MSRVMVIDTNRQPLMPCTPARARWMLKQGRAAVFRRFPFTLVLKDPKPHAAAPSLRVKIDPGSQVTGMAVVNDATGEVVWAAELTHRGQTIRNALASRRQSRCSRRQRHTRYRQPRFSNRTRPNGWLAPSLMSRVQNILTWVERLRCWCPIQGISMELVKFDTQLMQNAEISGVEYQQGELVGYEVKQYLLEKWGRACVYCRGTNVPLQTEHLIPKARGGSNRVSNLTLACGPCNQKKGTMTAAEFGYPDIQTQAKMPLKDAAAVNATRWALYHRVVATGLSVETGSGGRTNWQRTQRGLPKTHWIDASCVGASTPSVVHIQRVHPLIIMAKGRGSRQRVNVNASGFPRGKAKGNPLVHGFRTGDIVRATVPTGIKQGHYVGRTLVRSSGSFDIVTSSARIGGISYRYCIPIHRGDGYSYAQ